MRDLSPNKVSDIPEYFSIVGFLKRIVGDKYLLKTQQEHF